MNDVEIETLNATGHELLEAGPPARFSEIVRRGIDIVTSLSLAVITLPLVLALAIVSAISFRAWPIFCQERVGRGGGLFCCLKVRTLPTTVPSFTDKHDLARYHTPAFWRFVRSSHIDELPQLYVVLIGKMSMVGPRPEMEYLHDSMTPPFGSLRTSVRPGCTGLWQVSTSSGKLIQDAQEYDQFYLENRGLRLDLWIWIQTIRLMTGFGRAITIADVPGWARASRTADVVDLNVSIDLCDELEHSSTRRLAADASR